MPRVQHGKGLFDARVEAQCWLCWGGTDCSLPGLQLPLAGCCHRRPHHLENNFAAMHELQTVALPETVCSPVPARSAPTEQARQCCSCLITPKCLHPHAWGWPRDNMSWRWQHSWKQGACPRGANRRRSLRAVWEGVQRMHVALHVALDHSQHAVVLVGVVAAPKQNKSRMSMLTWMHEAGGSARTGPTTACAACRSGRLT